MTERASVEMQAGAVRHVAAGGDVTDEIRKALADAAETLAYHAARPALMKACAYFERTAAWHPEVFKEFPDAKIEAVRTKGDLVSYGK